MIRSLMLFSIAVCACAGADTSQVLGFCEDSATQLPAPSDAPAEPMAESVRPADNEALPQPHDSLGQAQEIEVESQDPAVEPIDMSSYLIQCTLLLQ